MRRVVCGVFLAALGCSANVAAPPDAGTTDGGAGLDGGTDAGDSGTDAGGADSGIDGGVDGGAPVTLSAPVISGSLTVGQTLQTTLGAWSNDVEQFAVAWSRCDSAGSGCVAITDANRDYYLLLAADAAATLRATVTASNAAGSGSATSAATSVVASAPPSGTVPAATQSPSLGAGAPTVGSVVSLSHGTWSGTQPIYESYAWQRCDSGGANCAALGAPNFDWYIPQSADLGATLRVQVTAWSPAGSTTVVSPASVAVAGPTTTAPSYTSPPTVTGAAAAGGAVGATTTTWSGADQLAFQWQRCDASGANCTELSGEVRPVYLPGTADVGSTLRVTVTASNVAGSISVTSAASAAVASTWTPPPPISPANPANHCPTGGCTAGTDSSALSFTFLNNGVSETHPYVLYRPTGLPTTAAVPLILVLHGAGSTAVTTASPMFDRVADQVGALVVYPDLANGSNTWGEGLIAASSKIGSRSDIPYFIALLQFLTSSQNVDPTHVYAVGSSEGASMSYALACDPAMAGMIAGIGMVTGTIGEAAYGIGPDCPGMLLPGHNTSYGVIAGEQDGIMLYLGAIAGPGRRSFSEPVTAARLAISIGCSANPTATTYFGGSNLLKRDTWTGCGGSNRAVELVSVPNGYHYFGGVTLAPGNLNSLRELWDFWTTH